MVATVLRLKLAVLRHSLARDRWRLVVLLLGVVWALGMVPTVLGGAWWLSRAGLATRGDVLVLAGTLLVLGWALIPVLVFGTDDSLDPVRFATFAVPAGRLVPALAVASALSVPAVFSAIVCACVLVAWSGAGAVVLTVAVVAAPLAWVTCLLTARVTTTLAARALGSRRGRQVAVATSVLVCGLVAVLVVRARAVGLDATLEQVPAVTRVLGWSPLALPWAAPVAAENGDLVGAGARLVLGLLCVAVLLLVWRALLAQALTRPAERGGRVRRRADTILEPRLGRLRTHRSADARARSAVAGRSWRYWGTDGRYVSSLVAGLVLPALIVGLGSTASRTAAIALGPLLGATLGWGRHNDTAFDGSAFWMHVVAGVSGSADRDGRARAVLGWAVPVVVVGSVAGAVLAGRPGLLPAALGAGLGLLAAGLAVSAVTSVVLPYPAPEAGASPFAAETGGIGASMAAQLVASVATTTVGLPVVIGLALAIWWHESVGWATLVVGVLGGVGALRVGVTLGGRALETRWAVLLHRVT